MLFGSVLVCAVSNLSPAADAKTHTLLVKHFDHLVKQKIYPYNVAKFSAEALRVTFGVLEIIFGALALCPHCQSHAARQTRTLWLHARLID